MRRIILVFALTLGFAVGCAYGTNSTRTVDDAPTLSVSGAPDGAKLFVDGIDFGLAENFPAATPVQVLPGVHIVEVRQGNTTLHREEVFSGTGSMTTISVSNTR